MQYDDNSSQPKPFYQNANKTERKGWFEKTNPWNTLDERIINALIEKFGEDPMFEVFVITSTKHNLLELYQNLDNSEVLAVPCVICSHIAGILSSLGSKALKQAINIDFRRNEEEFKYHYGIVLDSLETAIILDKYQVGAYLHLGVARQLLNRFDDSLKYAQDGLSILKEMKSDNFPDQLSKIKGMENAQEDFEQLENAFLEMIEDSQNEIKGR